MNSTRGAEPSLPDCALYDSQHDRPVLIPSQSNRPMTKQRFTAGAIAPASGSQRATDAQRGACAPRGRRVHRTYTHTYTHTPSQKPVHAPHTHAGAKRRGRAALVGRDLASGRTPRSDGHICATRRGRRAGNVGVGWHASRARLHHRREINLASEGFGRASNQRGRCGTARERGGAGANRGGGGRG